MLAAMNIFQDKRGLSRVELLCIIGIALVALVFAVALGGYALGLFRTGDDSGTMRAAEDLAQVSVAGSCLLPGCPGAGSSEHAAHADESGVITVYYDKGANVLVGEPPRGYNESTSLVIGKTACSVPKNSCVVQVQRNGTELRLEWVPVVPLGQS
ncbi:MAG: hypothetical protein ACI36W_04670 [Coriobacteriales bacterium]